VKISIETRCPYCGEPIAITSDTPMTVARRRCPRCGAVIIARISILLTAERITRQELEAYKKWLVEEKGLMPDTAARYAEMVEKYYTEGRYPRITAPLDYWREYAARARQQ